MTTNVTFKLQTLPPKSDYKVYGIVILCSMVRAKLEEHQQSIVKRMCLFVTIVW